MSLICPIISTLGMLLIKYVSNMRINIIDWTVAYFLLFSLVLVPISIIHFLLCQDCFSLKYFIQGFFASLTSAVASVLVDKALAMKDTPQGPTSAVLSVRIIIIVVVDSILTHSILTGM